MNDEFASNAIPPLPPVVDDEAPEEELEFGALPKNLSSIEPRVIAAISSLEDFHRFEALEPDMPAYDDIWDAYRAHVKRYATIPSQEALFEIVKRCEASEPRSGGSEAMQAARAASDAMLLEMELKRFTRTSDPFDFWLAEYIRERADWEREAARRWYVKHAGEPGLDERYVEKLRAIERRAGQAEDSDPALGVQLSTVTATQLTWLWPQRIPLGKLTLLEGDPGLGKSVVTLDLAARVTTGGRMPGGMGATAPLGLLEPAAVVLLSAEDALDDTILPRLIAAGGDPARVFSLATVPDRDGNPRPLSLPGDIPLLQNVIETYGAKLVIIDPLVSFLGAKADAHRDQDVRRALFPLAKMAEATGAAVLLLRHLTKDKKNTSPLYRGGGSIGIMGAVRSALLAAADPDDADRRVLAVSKMNLALHAPALAYTLISAEVEVDGRTLGDVARVQWLGHSAHSAYDLLDVKPASKLAEAEALLVRLLTPACVEKGELERAARQADISWTTIERAKKALELPTPKRYRPKGELGGSTSWWLLPLENYPPEDADRATLDTWLEEHGDSRAGARTNSAQKTAVSNFPRPDAETDTFVEKTVSVPPAHSTVSNPSEVTTPATTEEGPAALSREVLLDGVYLENSSDAASSAPSEAFDTVVNDGMLDTVFSTKVSVSPSTSAEFDTAVESAEYAREQNGQPSSAEAAAIRAELLNGKYAFLYEDNPAKLEAEVERQLKGTSR